MKRYKFSVTVMIGVFLLTFISLSATLAPEPRMISSKDFQQFNNSVVSKVVNGIPARPGNFPWQALIYKFLYNRQRKECGGALVSSKVILTAAHCIWEQDLKSIDHFTVILGSIHRNDSHGLKIESKKFKIHPRFDRFKLLNDIGLIFLRSRVACTSLVRPIALSTSRVPLGTPVFVSGFGVTEKRETSDILNYGRLAIVSNYDCAIYYHPVQFPPSALCCKGKDMQIDCFGDSGGALIAFDSKDQPIHVGIVSFGRGERLNNICYAVPSGYTRTASFVNWIKAHLAVSNF